jgi:hypothetical protein
VDVREIENTKRRLNLLKEISDRRSWEGTTGWTVNTTTSILVGFTLFKTLSVSVDDEIRCILWTK